MRGSEDNSVDTVNAAAAAIATADRRVQQASTQQRRKWGGCWSTYWCFGDTRNIRRISHASFGSEAILPRPAYLSLTPEITIHSSALALPFIAPPSSPTSTLQSEPPSAIHTVDSLFSLPASVDASCGSSTMFTVGPYTYDTQLVSPPVFSAVTTEPSTAPRTPPEPLHINTLASSEVPFSQLLLSSLDSNLRKGYEHRSYMYQYHSGTPASNFMSPSCGCSGASTPLPGFESHTSSSVTSHNVTRQISRLHSMQVDRTHVTERTQTSRNDAHNYYPAVNFKVSFDLSAEEVVQSIKDMQELESTALPSVSEDDASELIISSKGYSQDIGSTIAETERMLLVQGYDQVAQSVKDEHEVEGIAIVKFPENETELIKESKHSFQYGNIVAEQRSPELKFLSP